MAVITTVTSVARKVQQCAITCEYCGTSWSFEFSISGTGKASSNRSQYLSDYAGMDAEQNLNKALLDCAYGRKIPCRCPGCQSYQPLMLKEAFTAGVYRFYEVMFIMWFPVMLFSMLLILLFPLQVLVMTTLEILKPRSFPNPNQDAIPADAREAGEHYVLEKRSELLYNGFFSAGLWFVTGLIFLLLVFYFAPAKSAYCPVLLFSIIGLYIAGGVFLGIRLHLNKPKYKDCQLRMLEQSLSRTALELSQNEEFDFVCPNCEASLTTKVEHSNKQLICPSCDCDIKVPHVKCDSPVNKKTLHIRSKKRLVYILLGIFLGYLGIHNFYAGYKKGIAQLLITILTGWLVIPFIAVYAWVICEISIVIEDSAGNKFS